MNTTTSEAFAVKLPTLASWYYPELKRQKDIMVSIPRLQRGLVWRPEQVELLWDSILRGYPIGSFVVSNAIKKQNVAIGEGAKLHLLDGQQRSNAVAVGFSRPNFKKPSESKESSILWLDIQPEGSRPKSTREFMLRLTKIAHPWGYKLDDQCSRLSTGEIRESLRNRDSDNEIQGRRPTPAQLKPFKASYPVPLSFLLQAVTESESIEGCIKHLKINLSDLTQDWAVDACKLLSGESIEASFLHIWKALKRALNADLVLLKAPEELVHADHEDSLTHVELLFQRLNTQGTPLNGEELSYSMIKTYFPEVVDTVDAVEHLRMNPSRLVHLAIRAALTNTDSEKLNGGVDINRLRSLMKQADKTDLEYQVIKSYCTNLKGLPHYSKKIDSWLCYDESSAKLPNYIVSNIASGSREIYLLFLVWASQDGEGTTPDEVIEVIPGLATLLRWFSVKLDLCCNLIHKYTRRGLTLENISLGIHEAVANGYLILPRTPEETREFIGDFSPLNRDKETFQTWNWWGSLITLGEEQSSYAGREQEWHYFLDRIKGEKELLLYCQRHYLWERFQHYDQSNTELWEDHNRPWDYDHILARNSVVGKHQKEGGAEYKVVSREWIDNIGNFWACPFEDNRSYGDGEVSGKFTNEFLQNSVMTEEEFMGFNHSHGTTHSEEKARDFCDSARSRMLNLYKEWYDEAQIGRLLIRE